MRLLSCPVCQIPRQGPNAGSQCSTNNLTMVFEDDPLVSTFSHLPLLPQCSRGCKKILIFFSMIILRNKNTISTVQTLSFIYAKVYFKKNHLDKKKYIFVLQLNFCSLYNTPLLPRRLSAKKKVPTHHDLVIKRTALHCCIVRSKVATYHPSL